MGNYNEIVDNSEKFGGNIWPGWHMANFHDAISDCSLIELPIKGSNFTWSRGLVRM